MAKIKFPIVQVENNKFQLVVDLSIYAKEALTATCYKYTDKFYIHQQIDDTDKNHVKVVLESKEENVITSEITKEFCNNLIDQQVRFDTNAMFGHIRDLIVEEAFKPVNK